MNLAVSFIETIYTDVKRRFSESLCPQYSLISLYVSYIPRVSLGNIPKETDIPDGRLDCVLTI